MEWMNESEKQLAIIDSLHHQLAEAEAASGSKKT